MLGLDIFEIIKSHATHWCYRWRRSYTYMTMPLQKLKSSFSLTVYIFFHVNALWSLGEFVSFTESHELFLAMRLTRFQVNQPFPQARRAAWRWTCKLHFYPISRPLPSAIPLTPSNSETRYSLLSPCPPLFSYTVCWRCNFIRTWPTSRFFIPCCRVSITNKQPTKISLRAKFLSWYDRKTILSCLFVFIIFSYTFLQAEQLEFINTWLFLLLIKVMRPNVWSG